MLRQSSIRRVRDSNPDGRKQPAAGSVAGAAGDMARPRLRRGHAHTFLKQMFNGTQAKAAFTSASVTISVIESNGDGSNPSAT